ncbi:MAG TPA: hypothetical protein VN048_15760, partial [Verrucomicrobiae bacterium]|nr:hypothetical protein [Verrucomicrobiae bacterium]
MKTRFPLYLKILFWFFLNVAFLCAAFLIVARVQFRFGWDSLISGPAGEPLQNVSRLITTELAAHPRAEWNDVLKEFGDEHGVKFYLFHNSAGQLEQLAGETVDLPSSVHDRMMARRGMNPPHRGPDGPGGPDQEPPPEQRPDNSDFPPPPGRDGGPPMQREGPPRFMIHDSGRYWVVMPVFPGPGQRREFPPAIPLPADLIISSATLSAGGLFFNPTPWVIAGIGVILVSTLFWFPLVRGITRSLS